MRRANPVLLVLNLECHPLAHQGRAIGGLIRALGGESRQRSERHGRNLLQLLRGHGHDRLDIDRARLPHFSGLRQFPQRGRVGREDVVVVDVLAGDRVSVGHVLRVDLDRSLLERLQCGDHHRLQDQVIETVEEVGVPLELGHVLVVAVTHDHDVALESSRQRLAFRAAVILGP